MSACGSHNRFWGASISPSASPRQSQAPADQCDFGAEGSFRFSFSHTRSQMGRLSPRRSFSTSFHTPSDLENIEQPTVQKTRVMRKWNPLSPWCVCRDWKGEVKPGYLPHLTDPRRDLRELLVEMRLFAFGQK